MLRIPNEIEVGLIVEHSRSHEVHWVTEIDSPDQVTVADVEGSNPKSFSRRLFSDIYRKVPENGLKAKAFIDSEQLRDWASSAPLKLLQCVLVDHNGPDPATEKDIKLKLERFLDSSFKWKDWWDRATQLANDHSGSIRKRGKGWILPPNAVEPPEIPLPLKTVVEKPKPQPDRKLKASPKTAAKKVVTPQMLSDKVTSVVSGISTLKDYPDTDRQKITRRLLEDQIWWWLKKPDGAFQIAQYEKPLTELLKTLSDPMQMAEHGEILLSLVPNLTSKSAISKLTKVLDVIGTLTQTDVPDYPNSEKWRSHLITILLETSLLIRNESGRSGEDGQVIDKAVGLLLNQYPSLLIEVQQFFASQENASNEVTNDSKHALVASLLTSAPVETQKPIILGTVQYLNCRVGLAKSLVEPENLPNSVNLLCECIGAAAAIGDADVLAGIYELSEKFAENITQDNGTPIDKVWLAFIAADLELPGAIVGGLKTQIRNAVDDTTTNTPDNFGTHQILKIVSDETNRRVKNVEQRLTRQIKASEEVSETLRSNIQELGAELDAEKQFVERLQSQQTSGSRESEHFAKLAVLQPLVDLVQRLMLHQSVSDAKPDSENVATERLVELLATLGVTQTPNVDGPVDYEPRLHEHTAASVPSDSQVTVICPGFATNDPSGNEIIMKRAIVETI